MTALIARVRALCGGDTTFSDDDIQTLLDDHVVVLQTTLQPRSPFFTQHVAPYDNIESGAIIFWGYNAVLVENTDYTMDYQRGIVTTPQADYRGLRIEGKAYDIHAAAAEGWERIAARSVAKFDFSTSSSKFSLSQQYQQALQQAEREWAKAWPVVSTVERADTPTNPRSADSWNDPARLTQHRLSEIPS